MTLTTQFYTLIAMIGMGSYFGAALDTYNRFLKRSSRKSWLVFINDFLFWVVQGLIIFYVLFLVNEGELRLYLFLAMLCGFSAYQALLKKGYRWMLEFFIRLVVRTAGLAKKTLQILLFLPIKWVVTSVFLLLVGAGKLLVSIVLWIGKCVLYVLRLLLRPFHRTLLFFWNKMPKSIKKIVGNLYTGITGIYYKTKNLLSILKKLRK